MWKLIKMFFQRRCWGEMVYLSQSLLCWQKEKWTSSFVKRNICPIQAFFLSRKLWLSLKKASAKIPHLLEPIQPPLPSNFDLVRLHTIKVRISVSGCSFFSPYLTALCFQSFANCSKSSISSSVGFCKLLTLSAYVKW